MSAYGAIGKPATLTETLPSTIWRMRATSDAFVTVHHLTLETAKSFPGLVEYLGSVMASVVEEGQTYPQETLVLDAFEAYFFSGDVFIAIIPASAALTAEDGTETSETVQSACRERSWEECIAGAYYVKPNYPGRSSHICNGGFVVPPVHRGSGYGSALAKSYLHYAPKLGYRASVFNLVYVNNVASVKLWERLNFTRAGLIPQAGRLRRKDGQGEEYVDAIVFYKSFVEDVAPPARHRPFKTPTDPIPYPPTNLASVRDPSSFMATAVHPHQQPPPALNQKKPHARSYAPPPQAAPSSKADPYYGHEYIANLCARFITHLFACPPFPPQSTHSQAKLPYFIAYALHRTKLHQAVTYAALVLLQRLKARFPTARGSSGHRLFISAFMIASKVICDDTYSNKSWSIVAQGMFSLREINQMEREMCSYLDWELTVDNPILSNFEAMVRRDFPPDSKGPYPTYSLHMVSKRAAKAAASASNTPIPEPNSTTSPIPAFGQPQRQATPTKPYPPPIIPPPPLYKKSASPTTPETPGHSYSNTTSPASSVSPPTPTGPVDLNAKIHDASKGYEMSGALRIAQDLPPTHPLKAKMFAFAAPAVW
uniref:Alternative cyclin Pcl12 n=1 Tax=Mycena chlorophos TaxID=658473 RepID=A0ABQ0M3G4_MYCCL|nr:alternative cyclin Pcl12 [Mycena chlorophos]